MEELVKDADRLVSCLANKVARTFDFSLTGASSRSCKYVLNTLMQTFQNKRLAHAVKENTLDSLVTELLLWLLDDRVPHMDDGSQLLKALNVLMLKILDNADRTSFFVVLINLLRPLDPSRWPSPASNELFASRNQKFSDLVVKCLIKLTKDFVETDLSLNNLGIANGYSANHFEESDNLVSGHFVAASNNLSAVSKVQISTPPGFSFPSRLPPPGFSSHERMGQAFDTTSGTSLLGPFLLRGSYQTPLNGNIGGAGDIEFMDPAILAVGKGRLQGALNSSMLDMRSNYNSQLNYIENEARL